MSDTLSPRQELLAYTEMGSLRQEVSGGRLSSEAVDLLVTVVLRYCEPRRRKRHYKVG